MDALEPGGLSRRKWRALAWGAAAAIVVMVAAVVYLRPTPSQAFIPFATPTVRPGEATANFVMYDFPSPAIGWAMGFTDGSSGFSVSRTVDGGKNWQRRLTSGQVPAAPLLLRFFNDQRGFVAVGGRLLRTSDGGASWKSLNLPETRTSFLDFRDERRGWLLVPIADGAGQPAHLYSTDDAGDSWQTLPDAPLGANMIALRRTTEMWVSSWGPGTPRVYRSTDGGRSWQRREIPIPEGIEMDPTASWNTFVNLLPGKGAVASSHCGCFAGRSFQSPSFAGGATWRFVPAEPYPGGPAHRSVIAYQDDFHWWFIDARILYRTSNAGQTWTKISDQLPDWPYSPRVIDAKHAWALVGVFGGYGLAITSDAGLHWTRVTDPPGT